MSNRVYKCHHPYISRYHKKPTKSVALLWEFDHHNSQIIIIQFLKCIFSSESDFRIPKDLQNKNEWTYTGKILGTTGTGQGEVYLLRQISTPYKEAALKVYKRTDEQVKRMRSYREMIALRTMEKGKCLQFLIIYYCKSNVKI